MKKYKKYKDSGIEWIGEIPEHWEVKRLKYVVSLNDETLSEKTEDETLIDYIEIGDLKNGFIRSTEYSFEKAPSRARRIVRNGDVIVSTVRTYLKAIAQITGDKDGYIASTGFAVLRPKKINSRFLGFYSFSPFFINNTIANSVGVTYPAINASNILEFQIQIPTPEEQTAIANYLDRKTAQIDELIADKKRLLELYEEEKTAIINQAVTKGINPDVKMKDSGIEWLGEIPEHWEVKKLKYIKAKEKNAFVDGPFGSNLKTKHFVENGDVYVIDSGFVTSGAFELKRDFKTITAEHFKTVKRSECKAGDIIIAKIGANFGMTGILPELDKPSLVSGNSLKLSINSSLYDNKFIQFQFLCLKWFGEIDLLVKGSAQPALSMGPMSELNFAIPENIEQQKKIVRFIESELSFINTKSEKTKKLIDLLTEYRTALISEVVTGKIKVTE